jgi:hypothetical protein
MPETDQSGWRCHYVEIMEPLAELSDTFVFLESSQFPFTGRHAETGFSSKD